MTEWESFLLGLVQGITEFFPVSSSAHLILVQKWLGFGSPENLLFFDLICHLGTLGSVGVFFRKEIIEILASKTKILPFVIAILPLFPLVFFLKGIEKTFNPTHYLGLGFLISAGLIFAGEYIKLPSRSSEIKKSFWVGCIQAAAIFPGISRSGATISLGRSLGWSLEDAVRFSFLLSIPTILGGVAVKAIKGIPDTLPVTFGVYMIAFITSMLSGLAAIHLLYWIVQKRKFFLFAWYCLLVSILLIFFP